MQLAKYSVYDKRQKQVIGYLHAHSLFNIYRAINKQYGTPLNKISKVYQIQRQGAYE